jgi:hypothetical protein
MEEYKIPLKNRKKEIVDYTFVSKEDFEHLSKIKWYLSNKYVVNNTSYRMHRYIIIQILKNNIDSHTFVDHINNNSLDNRRKNLRIVTCTENSRNRTKKVKATSKYYGISFNKRDNKFSVKIRYDNSILCAAFDNEEDAAYQYDLWIKKYNITCAKLNNIKKPENFIEYKKKEKIDNLPIGVSRNRNDPTKYDVRFHQKRCGKFNTIEEASNKYQELLKKYNENNLQKILNKPIVRNKDNQCIIELFNNQKEKVGETIVDEDIYYKLQEFSWWYKTKIKGGYVLGNVNKKNILLHRFILNYYGKDVVDHINSNPLDNRKCNLRVVTKKQNAMNVTVCKNSTSKYIGVCSIKERNTWSAQIHVNKKKIHLGTFKNEENAAKCRDIATKKYFGEHGKLNFH